MADWAVPHNPYSADKRDANGNRQGPRRVAKQATGDKLRESVREAMSQDAKPTRGPRVKTQANQASDLPKQTETDFAKGVKTLATPNAHPAEMDSAVEAAAK